MATQLGTVYHLLRAKRIYAGAAAGSAKWAEGAGIQLCGFVWAPDPWVELTIPGAATNVLQQINTGKKLEWFVHFTNWFAPEELFFNIDVDNDVAGTQTAVASGNTRTVIDYFVWVGTLYKQVRLTGEQTEPEQTWTFTNAVIRDVVPRWDDVNAPIVVRGYADSVTETVA